MNRIQNFARPPFLGFASLCVYFASGATPQASRPRDDKAFALLNDWMKTQSKQAILNYRIDDLVLGPGQRSGLLDVNYGIKLTGAQ